MQSNVDTYSIRRISTYKMGSPTQEDQIGEAKKLQQCHFSFKEVLDLTQYK